MFCKNVQYNLWLVWYWKKGLSWQQVKVGKSILKKFLHFQSIWFPERQKGKSSLDLNFQYKKTVKARPHDPSGFLGFGSASALHQRILMRFQSCLRLTERSVGTCRHLNDGKRVNMVPVLRKPWKYRPVSLVSISRKAVWKISKQTICKHYRNRNMNNIGTDLSRKKN